MSVLVLRSKLTRFRDDLAAMLPRRLRRLTSARRKALLLTLVSLLGWSLWNGFRKYEHPWGDLSKGRFTDHFSHMNAARLFPRMRLDIWRVPIANKFRQLTSEELDAAPSDVRAGGVAYKRSRTWEVRRMAALERRPGPFAKLIPTAS